MATFPHLTATGPAPLPRDVVATYRHNFYKRVAQGSIRPIVFPYHLYGLFLLIAYLCIPHTKRPYVYKARFAVLGAIGAFQWHLIWSTTSASMATSFLSGMISAWMFVVSVTWLVFYRPQFDAKRIEVRPKGWVGKRGGGRVGDGRLQEIYTGGQNGGGKPSTQQRPPKDVSSIGQSGRVKEEENGHLRRRPGSYLNSSGGAIADIPEDRDDSIYYWQSYPEDNFRERINWISDLVMNFRGPGWNWAIPPLPTYPKSVKKALNEFEDEPIESAIESVTQVSKYGYALLDSRRELFWDRVPRFIIGYFLLDIARTFSMKDPYFVFGPTTYDPAYCLQNLSPVLLWVARQTLSGMYIVLGLDMAFNLGTIVQCLLLGPKTLGLRGHAWQYPSSWGSYKNILNKGLNGFWGGFWHQTFRFAFAAPTNYLIKNKYIKPRSITTKVLGLVFAFGISGLLHAAGSHTQLPLTYPWHAITLFMLQPLGIMLQTCLCTIFSATIKTFPKHLREAGNVVYTLAFLFSTCWLMGDDFARGGMWFFEPIPISTLRGLGFGSEGDGWWCWEHIGVGWYSGKHWWDSGVAF